MMYSRSMYRLTDYPDITPEGITVEARRLWHNAMVSYDSLCLRGYDSEFSWYGLRGTERDLRLYGSLGAVALADEIALLLRRAVAWAPEWRGAPVNSRA